MEIEAIFDLVTSYGISFIAIVISIFSFNESRKVNKVQLKLNEIEEKLKKYELEEKEKEREAATKAIVEVRIYNVSRGKYKLKIWNSGQVTAYDVDYQVPEDLRKVVFRDKVPFEILESGKSFDEHIVYFMGMPSKFKVITTWKDSDGNKFEKEQFVSF